ncbi:hypothetical protein DPMN_085236 [Dreissena polymorpha]|uniref:Uncharacterized protein n=1 Tax=Dreissena polymorpha TaxID=45954 RepID=A0A9D3YEN1_DREPO|nr:hypothetical protein DPMN_085236 [Dreissena polymorpha]
MVYNAIWRTSSSYPRNPPKHFQDMAPDGRKDGRTDNAKTISLCLWQGIITVP